MARYSPFYFRAQNNTGSIRIYAPNYAAFYTPYYYTSQITTSSKAMSWYLVGKYMNYYYTYACTAYINGTWSFVEAAIQPVSLYVNTADILTTYYYAPRLQYKYQMI